LTAYRDFHVGTGLRISNGVAYHVLDCSTQLFPRTHSRAHVHGSDPDGTVFGLTLEVSIDGNFLNQTAQLNPFLAARVSATVDSSQREELADQLIEMIHFKRDPVEIFRPLLGGTLSQQTLCHAQTGERRTQFMRDISEEPLLSMNQGFDSLRHAIKAHTQAPDLVAS